MSRACVCAHLARTAHTFIRACVCVCVCVCVCDVFGVCDVQHACRTRVRGARLALVSVARACARAAACSVCVLAGVLCTACPPQRV